MALSAQTRRRRDCKSPHSATAESSLLERHGCNTQAKDKQVI